MIVENSPTIIVLNLAAAAALLFGAVRLGRTGFEGAFGSQLRFFCAGRRETGLIGLALIFLSLDLIRDTNAPLANSEAAPGALNYLSADPLTAFLLAVYFAWLVHYCVAAILLLATLAAQSVLPLSATFAMVLGTNLGGAFIAFVLTLQADVSVRRVVSSNLFLRGGGAGLVLFLLFRLDGVDLVSGASTVQQVLNLQFLLNFMLLVGCIPFLGPMMRLAESIFADDKKTAPRPTDVRTWILRFRTSRRAPLLVRIVSWSK